MLSVLCVRLQRNFGSNDFRYHIWCPGLNAGWKRHSVNSKVMFTYNRVSQSLTLVIYSVLVALSKTTILQQKMSTTIPQSFTISYRMMDQWWKRTLKAPKMWHYLYLGCVQRKQYPETLSYTWMRIILVASIFLCNGKSVKVDDARTELW